MPKIIRKLRILDTTLRDGEQAPHCSMQLTEKLEIARQLENLGVDIIEAGFAASSKGDFEAVAAISKTVKKCVVASLARAATGDIDAAYEALKDAAFPRIHIVLATSPIHMAYKLKLTEAEVLAKAAKAVAYARTLCPDVQFSCEDAARSDRKFLCEVIEAVIDCGASTVNIADTVGYTSPSEFYDLIKYIRENVKNIYKVVLAVHCHNDLGMAVANTLSAVLAGAEQVECTVNGIGERAGNAALEEIVMAINTRRDFYGMNLGIITGEISRTSKLVYSILGQKPSLI